MSYCDIFLARLINIDLCTCGVVSKNPVPFLKNLKQTSAYNGK